MPATSDDCAPSFSGKTEDVLRFFDDFEQYAESCGLSAKENCSVIIRYITKKKVQNLWKNATGWTEGLWKEFKEAILEECPDADKADRVTLRDLDAIIIEQRKKSITTIAKFFKYHRKFRAVALSLLASGALSLSDRDRYFWTGLDKAAQRSLLYRIENTDKDYDRSKPIDMDVMAKAAKYVFAGNAFEDDSNSMAAIHLRDLTDSEDFSSDDESTDEEYAKKKKGKKAVKKKKHVSDSDSSDEEDNRGRKKNKKRKEESGDSSSEEDI